MNEKEALITQMKASVDTLIQEVNRLSEKAFSSQIITGSWTAKDILSHVAAWDIVFCDMSEALLKGESTTWPDFEEFNKREVSARRNLARDEIVKEVKKNRKAYTDFISSLTDSELKKPLRDDFTAKKLAESIISHDVHHIDQIRAKK